MIRFFSVLSVLLSVSLLAFSVTPIEQSPFVLPAASFAHAADFELDFERVTDATYTQTQADAIFDRCEDIVSATLAALPASHVATVQKITLTLDPQARRGLGGGNEIVIRCTGMSAMELAAVTVHEVAHTVDATLLQGTSNVTTAFSDGPYALPVDDPSITFYTLSWASTDTQKFVSDQTDFVSTYAASDPFEDFAESYTAYVLHGESFSTAKEENFVLQAKYDFLKETVFHGTIYALDNGDTVAFPVKDITVLAYSTLGH